MNTSLRFAALLFVGVTLLSNCKQNTTSTPTPTPPVVVVPQAAPSISGVSPEKAVAGSSLTITGQNLQNAKEVKINGQVVAVSGATNTATSLLVIVPDFTTPLNTTLAVGLSVSTSGGISNELKLIIAPQAEIAQTPVPNGLIPGGPLSLTVSNVSAITGIDFMKDKDEVTPTIPIPASSFLINNSGRIMLKVPVDLSAAGWIRVNTEYGNGKARQISKVAGSDGITTSNIATSVGNIATGTISDGCNPNSFFYCIPLPDGSSYPYDRFAPETSDKDIPNGSRLVLGFKYSGSPPPYTSTNCSEARIYYSTLPMGNAQYHVFSGQFNGGNGGEISYNPTVTLKLERNGQNYTGAAIIEIGNTMSQVTNYPTIIARSDTYVGSRLKNGDIYAYSVTSGKPIKLCSQTAFYYNKDRTIIDCSTCK